MEITPELKATTSLVEGLEHCKKLRDWINKNGTNDYDKAIYKALHVYMQHLYNEIQKDLLINNKF